MLVLYGAISLWLDKGSSASQANRLGFCQVWLCQEPASDSPTDFTSPPDLSIAQARTGLVLNPASAYRWTDLAEAETDAGHVDAGKYCERQALSSAPGNPTILFRAARLYLRLEDYPDALQSLVAVLRNPDLAPYYDRVFTLYSQMDLPLNRLLDQGLPHTPQASNAFLRFWIKQGRLEEAETTWDWINKNALTSVQSAGSYVALLAKDDQWEKAMDSWSDYTARLDPSYTHTNWVYNGSFEMQPVDCPFDWKLMPGDGVEVARDTDQQYKGVACLRLHYTQAPEDSDAQASQIVMLKPGKWEIKAAMKTQSLTGPQGVVIRVVDAEDPTRLDVVTNTFQRTQEWTPISAVFDVGKATRLARVEILRPPAHDMDIRFMGSVWIDAVELAPVL